ncbi:hypothetical protein PVAP13_9NG175865 [Panicum virgatum]|uniref:Uncharacterized protein n=1 Tax=Panicum virgatum TaxID=38727 RepID=A0A8T0MNA8_PANVG|nr:hypothetical protein PVAP13_9NG175865 [Panicum virgatum]
MVSAFAASGLPENFRAPSPALHFFPIHPSWVLADCLPFRCSSFVFSTDHYLLPLRRVSPSRSRAHSLLPFPALLALGSCLRLCCLYWSCVLVCGPPCRFSRCISVGCLIRSLKILVRYILFLHTSSNLLRSCRTWRPDLHYPILFFTHLCSTLPKVVILSSAIFELCRGSPFASSPGFYLLAAKN